jgi:hypothetical protein
VLRPNPEELRPTRAARARTSSVPGSLELRMREVPSYSTGRPTSRLGPTGTGRAHNKYHTTYHRRRLLMRSFFYESCVPCKSHFFIAKRPGPRRSLLRFVRTSRSPTTLLNELFRHAAADLKHKQRQPRKCPTTTRGTALETEAPTWRKQLISFRLCQWSCQRLLLQLERVRSETNDERKTSCVQKIQYM